MGCEPTVCRVFHLVWLRIHQAVAAAEEFQPDIIVTIDAKGFSFRVLEGIRNCYAAKGQRRPPCVHYVSPSVWAYKNGAASLSKLKSIVDHVLCILAFEPALYKSSGVQATFVGHPALEDVWRNQDSDALIGSEDCLMSPPWRIKADGSDILASHGFQVRTPGSSPGREFIKEFVFEHCTPKNLASATSELLDSRRDPCQPHASDDDSELVLGALGPNVMFSADDAGLLEENDCTTTCHPVNSSVPQAHCYDGWMERASPSLRHYLYYEARRLDDLAEESSPQVGQHPWRRVWNKAHLDFGVEGGIGQLRRRQHSLGTMAKQNPTNFSVRAHEGTLVVNHGPPPFWSPVAVPRPSLLAAQVVFQMLFRKRLRI
ncbi:hypothetical protein CBR_g34007 [Chara braunii]|uniref:lipid-A-disaccharide synthase n=1 Tax=Chara braunii TaxID=69332 RepID=A0A388LHN0_CHABU|nr:hypothetical protein CBR_g34007 [Chara braunii]|eukprot:GBG81826.1 hypothetical protein CBR_g34007 [Chara braunii]